MDKMTEFQEKCENALTELLNSMNISFDRKEWVLGNEENFFEGEVRGIKFWIYEDGADIFTQNEKHRLEELDFKSLEELQEFFISTFKRLLASQNP
ncbi:MULTISPECIES: hypothetical protein [unclassified Nitrospina]|uniref:hypothetical protein n=1 Tax=unclassified Nitrospina TaxID=2638683 RepID=UPI003F9750D4